MEIPLEACSSGTNNFFESPGRVWQTKTSLGRRGRRVEHRTKGAEGGDSKEGGGFGRAEVQDFEAEGRGLGWGWAN